MKIVDDSPLYEQYFKSFTEGLTVPHFEGTGPTYASIKNAFINGENVLLFSGQDTMNGGQSQDMRQAMRLAMYDLAVPFSSDGDAPEKVSINIPTSLVEMGLPKIIYSDSIDAVLSNKQVVGVFNALASGDPKKAGIAVLGVGMAAVGIAVPVVGWIGSAIIALAAGISAAFNRIEAKKAAAEAERARQLYSEFPPMQVGGADMDSDTINKAIRPMLRTFDWTNIWMPAFSGDWVGVGRTGGIAFAQGDAVSADDELTNEGTKFFQPSGGVGVIPGTDQMTRVIQVDLETNPDDINAEAWLAFTSGKGPDPRGIDINGRKGKDRVKDTGMYYAASSRLASSLWEMLMATKGYEIHGNPYLYRIDARKMKTAWQAWAEGALQYIREVCYPWYPEHLNPDGSINAKLRVDTPDPVVDLVGFAGTGIALSTIMWCGQVVGGSSLNPKYGPAYPRPNGWVAAELAAKAKAYGWPQSGMSSLYSGAFLPILDPAKWPDHLMGERYHRGPLGVSIEGTLSTVLAQQARVLRNTLVSAYVSERDAAFAGPENADQLGDLRKLRQILLTSEDRFCINIDDVPESEPNLPGKPKASWREELIAAGVPLVKAKGPKGLKLGAGGIKPPGKDLPCEAGIPCDKPVPPYEFVPGNPNPWEPYVPKRVGRPDVKSSGGGSGVLWGAAAVAGLGTALGVAYALRGKKRRGFSAGRAV